MPYVDSDIDDFSDVQLINEIESRGFKVIDEDDVFVPVDVQEDIDKLVLDYLLTGQEFFKLQLKQFFQKYTNKTFV